MSSIGNLNIFTDKQEFKSLNCDSTGDYLSWIGMDWIMDSGEKSSAIINAISKDLVCGKNTMSKVIIDVDDSFGK